LRMAQKNKEFKKANDIKIGAKFANPINKMALSLAGLNNAMGVITMRDQNAATNPQNTEQFTLVSNIIMNDINAINEQYMAGKKLVFVGSIGSMLNVTPKGITSNVPILSVTPTQPSSSVEKFSYARTANNSYEVSTA